MPTSSAPDKASRSVTSAATPSHQNTSMRRSPLRTMPSATDRNDDSVEVIDLESSPQSAASPDRQQIAEQQLASSEKEAKPSMPSLTDNEGHDDPSRLVQCDKEPFQ